MSLEVPGVSVEDPMVSLDVPLVSVEYPVVTVVVLAVSVEVPKAESAIKTATLKKELLMVEDTQGRLEFAIWKRSLEGKVMLVDYRFQKGATGETVLKVMSTGRREGVDEMG